jgi:hypothetical protein
MNVEQYLEMRRGTPLREVSFGFVTVTLLNADELDEAQVGYGVGPHGESLAGGGAGDWESSWLVIAREDLVGDPVFVDLNSEGLPVFTAMHGAGAWEPEQIASSFQGFIRALGEVERVSHGRGNPVELERNPLPDSERELVLRRIAEASETAPAEFWSSWLSL